MAPKTIERNRTPEATAPGRQEARSASLSGVLVIIVAIALAIALALAALGLAFGQIQLPGAQVLSVVPPAGAPVVAYAPEVETADATDLLEVQLQNWEWDEATSTLFASGLVLGVAEDGGTCSLRVTGGEVEHKVGAGGMVSGNTTTCRLNLSNPALAGGTWDLVLVYSNVDGEVRSEPLRAVLD